MHHVDQINPNGTAESIHEWAKAVFADPTTGKLDTAQQHAFEVIASMFVLTFHQEAKCNEGRPSIGTQMPSNWAQYAKVKSKLRKMTGMRQHDQLIMFLTGAGGSGKTRVINAVLVYAKGFCKELHYVFDKRMIVVTVMTGVAVTLINGKTLNTAAKFYNKTITNDHIKEWVNAQLFIINEIPFATSADLQKPQQQTAKIETDHQSKIW